MQGQTKDTKIVVPSDSLFAAVIKPPLIIPVADKPGLSHDSRPGRAGS